MAGAGVLPGGRGLPRAACEYGTGCYQKGGEHLVTYAHPGDPDYTYGHVTFKDAQQPELNTLWDFFNFFDCSGSGNLHFHEFQRSVCEVRSYVSRALDADAEWEAAGGGEEGHLSWVRFASWAGRAGINLPVGIDDAPGRPKPCRFRLAKDGQCCECKAFCAVPGQQVCSCGHRRNSHRSESAQQSLPARLVSNVPSHWQRGAGQLVQVKDLALLSLLQTMLDTTHKVQDNWTRDRGCSLHGVNGCSPACIYKNRAAVPSGYMLAGAYRNQNPMLWARYTLARAAILQDCAANGCTPELVESSKPPFNDLDSSPLVQDVNEWRCLHGAPNGSCKEICATNFNMTLVGTGSTWKKDGGASGMSLYGSGVYFAERITKADEYVVPMAASAAGEMGDLCSVLVCRVVGGRTKVCLKNEINAEALKAQVLSGPHHSVCGDRVKELKKPYREFVVYDRDQVFPEFLLTYVRTFSSS